MPPPKTSAALAASLVVPGGSGTAADVAAVRPEIAKLSVDILSFLLGKKAKIVACRDFGDRRGAGAARRGPARLGVLVPRRTWDSVPGTYLAEGRRVIVATVATPAGGRMVPDIGAGHGSANLAVHETLHGRHRLASSVLKAQSFKRAREADFPRLPDYLRQDGVAGLEETYAESGARFFQRDPTLAADWPALFAFWSGAPIPAAATRGAPVLAPLGGGGTRGAAGRAGDRHRRDGRGRHDHSRPSGGAARRARPRADRRPPRRPGLCGGARPIFPAAARRERPGRPLRRVEERARPRLISASPRRGRGPRPVRP